jgi:catechol 2,3-dioxygenase-like lactoylglutathione lyase family enzyme
VPEYDTGMAFYRDKLGFSVREDKDMGGGKRWVVVAPSDDAHAPAFLLAKAADAFAASATSARRRVRASLSFSHTDDFDRDYARFRANGVQFDEAAPRQRAATAKSLSSRTPLATSSISFSPSPLAFPALPSGAAPFTSEWQFAAPQECRARRRQGVSGPLRATISPSTTGSMARSPPRSPTTSSRSTNQNGAFLVRCSSRPGHFVVTWLDNGTVVHTLASPTDAGYAVEGDAQKYESIPQLVELYAAHLTTAVSRV